LSHLLENFGYYRDMLAGRAVWAVVGSLLTAALMFILYWLFFRR